MKPRTHFPWLGAFALAWAAQVGAAPVSAPATSSAQPAQVARSLGPQRREPSAQTGAPEMIVHRGQRLSQALEDFAQQNGWTVLWYCQDWAAPGQTVFHGDFMTVSQEFIKSIAADGADIHGKWWLGNKTLVVTGSGAMQ